jgi:mannose-6-phosphate isomerase
MGPRRSGRQPLGTAGIVLTMSGQQNARDDAHRGAGRRLAPARSLLRMVNPIRHYDWGSLETLARMQRREVTGAPEAELWMGAHPVAPSAVVQDDGDARRLDELVAEAPDEVLGHKLVAAFGPRLPFLLKVLAIAQPLSLQVHPDRDRAREGFTGEVQVLGEHRYVDPYPKPELMYALEPVEALCGFRPAADAVRLLAQLDGPRAATIAEPLHLALRGADDGGMDETAALEEAFRRLVTWPDDDRADLAADAADEAGRLLARAGRPGGPELSDGDRRALEWVTRLADQHPKDPLVTAPLLLDLVVLDPGQTLFVPAGAPHAHLNGTGVEIMGNSDNVLRAGLTHKAIAIEELLHVVDGRSRPQRDLPEVRLGDHEVAWRPPVPEFQLTRVRVPQDKPVEADGGLPGPQIVLCTAGRVSLRCDGHEEVLLPGESAFVRGGAGQLILVGPGEVFRAAAGGEVAHPAPPG